MERISRKSKFKIINISTDDVFPQLCGKVSENDRPKPTSIYGKSKLKGEVKAPNVLDIRTSFIGFDPIDRKGLIEWILGEKVKP